MGFRVYLSLPHSRVLTLMCVYYCVFILCVCVFVLFRNLRVCLCACKLEVKKQGTNYAVFYFAVTNIFL